MLDSDTDTTELQLTNIAQGLYAFHRDFNFSSSRILCLLCVIVVQLTVLIYLHIR